jgi:hypothetical protein
MKIGSKFALFKGEKNAHSNVIERPAQDEK